MYNKRDNELLEEFFTNVKNKDLQAINFLLEQHLFLRQEIVSSSSIVINLVTDGNLEVLELLYPFHANKQQFLETCLLVAVDIENIDIVQFSINKGVNVNCNSMEAFNRVVKKDNGNIEIVQLLLDNGGTLDTQSSGLTHNSGPFYEAVNNNHFDIVKLLMKVQKEVNFHDYYIAKTVKQNTPKANEILKYLIEYDLKHHKFSSIKLFDKFRAIALRFSTKEQKEAKTNSYFFGSYEELLKNSAVYGNIEMIEFLIDKGVNKHIVEWHGNDVSKSFMTSYQLNEKLNKQLNKNTDKQSNQQLDNHFNKKNNLYGVGWDEKIATPHTTKRNKI